MVGCRQSGGRRDDWRRTKLENVMQDIALLGWDLHHSPVLEPKYERGCLMLQPEGSKSEPEDSAVER